MTFLKHVPQSGKALEKRRKATYSLQSDRTSKRELMFKKPSVKEENLGFPRFLTTKLLMKREVTTVNLLFPLYCFCSSI